MRIRFARFLLPVVSLSCGMLLGACSVDYAWNADTKGYVETGFAVPSVGTATLTGDDLPAVGSISMYQTASAYVLSIPVTNAKLLSLQYQVVTDVSDAVIGASGTVVASGSFTDVSGVIAVPVVFTTAADKKNISFTIQFSSSIRTYASNSLVTVHVNTRPSSVTPKLNAALESLGTGTWNPVYSATQADVYWSFDAQPTDTDIASAEFLYVSGSVSGKSSISYTSGSFGTNAYTVSGLTAGIAVTVSATVFDDEGLASVAVTTGTTTPERAPVPTLVRGTGTDQNLVTVTAPDAASRIWCKVDSESVFTARTSPFSVTLTGLHSVQAYTAKDNMFVSETVSGSYQAVGAATISFTLTSPTTLGITFPTTPLSATESSVLAITATTTSASASELSDWKWYLDGTTLLSSLPSLGWTPTSAQVGTHTITVFVTYGGFVYSGDLKVNVDAASTATTFSVVYMNTGADSGEPPVDYTAYASGSNATVLGNINSLARSSYVFICWNTASNGAGANYPAGASLPVSANVTLYPRWVLSSGGSFTYGDYSIQYSSGSFILQSYNGVTANDDVSIPSLVTSVASIAFSGKTNVRSVVIPDSVTVLGTNAFYGCTNIVSVTLPDTITTLGDYAFSNCSSLTSIDLPSALTIIPASAFANCTSLSSVTIGANVASIKTFAFNGCSSLASVTLYRVAPPTLWTNNFTQPPLASIKVPSGTAATYQAAANWDAFSGIISELP